MLLRERAWNHNIHYHSLVLAAVPRPCARALDVGCGEGQLARQLALRCGQVTGLDIDEKTLQRAAAAPGPPGNVHFVHGDLFEEDFGGDTFDFISAVAVLHHLPLRPALERLRQLLRPGGTLAVVGLYAPRRPADYAWFAAGWPASRIVRQFVEFDEMRAPIRKALMPLREIREATNELLPGSKIRQRLFFRYSLLWRRPE